MRSLINIKSLVIIALSLTMLAGCGRKNGLSPTGASTAKTQTTAQAADQADIDPLIAASQQDEDEDQSVKPLDVDVGDKPFFLDKLL